ILAVLAQRCSLGGHIQCVEQLLHLAPSSAISCSIMRLRQARAGRVTASGRHISLSEQARQRWRLTVGRGVLPLTNTSARAVIVSSVNRRRSASIGTV